MEKTFTENKENQKNVRDLMNADDVPEKKIY